MLKLTGSHLSSFDLFISGKTNLKQAKAGRRTGLFLILLAVHSSLALALPAQAEGQYLVDEVRIEGNRLIPTEDITSVVKTRKGDKFDRDQVMEDLKAINGLGHFDDQSLQVNPELTGSGILLS